MLKKIRLFIFIIFSDDLHFVNYFSNLLKSFLKKGLRLEVQNKNLSRRRGYI